MALAKYIARLTKIIVDSEGITFPEAEARLRRLTLEVIVGSEATTPAAHAAVLTAVSVGARTFVGGVRVVGLVEQPLNSALPIVAPTLGEAAATVGASGFDGAASHRIIIGALSETSDGVYTWWAGWRAGVEASPSTFSDVGDNPLVGVAAGALAVGEAFRMARTGEEGASLEVDLWPSDDAPLFSEVFLPGAVWLVGLGNLGQAFMWALSSLPYADPREVSLVLQDCDKVSEENWGTSVLVKSETYGALKTKVVEQWAVARGFDVRRVDRRLLSGDRLEDDDPRLALSGVDKIGARKLLARTGFDCVVDAGLGRKAADFDRYRVTVFDSGHPVDRHFEGQTDEGVGPTAPLSGAYQDLQDEIGSCGASEIAGASVAAPFVSAIAAAVAIARSIAVTSGCACPRNEVRKLSARVSKFGPAALMQGRGFRHAGRPSMGKVILDPKVV